MLKQTSSLISFLVYVLLFPDCSFNFVFKRCIISSSNLTEWFNFTVISSMPIQFY